jgi:hypothetical protein
MRWHYITVHTLPAHQLGIGLHIAIWPCLVWNCLLLIYARVTERRRTLHVLRVAIDLSGP